MNLHRGVAALACAAVVSAASPADAEVVAPIPVACGTTTEVPFKPAQLMALSDQGDVGGWGNRFRAVSWNLHSGTSTWYGGIEGGLHSRVTHIAGDWRVGVGQVGGSGGPERTWRRAPGDWRLQPIGPATEGENILPAALNDHGAVGGNWHQQQWWIGDSRPFIWHPDGRVQFLAAYGDRLHLVDLNNDGVALLSEQLWSAPWTQLIVWRSPGSQVTLPHRGDEDQHMFPLQLLDDGTVLGYDLPGFGLWSWTEAGGYVELGKPLPGARTIPLHASDSGAVVGEYSPSDGQERTFLYRPGVGFEDLQSGLELPVEDTEIYVPPRVWAINDSSQVLMSHPTYGPLTDHLLVWTPCP